MITQKQAHELQQRAQAPSPAKEHRWRDGLLSILGVALPLVQKGVVFIACVALGVFPLFFASCGTQTGKVMLTATDNGKTVSVHTGDQVIIQLDENPSTGYLWAIDKTDNAVLPLQGSDYTPTPGGALGSGGTRVFTFVAKNPGTAHLQLKLWRSFEGDSSILQRYAVTIQVQS